MNKTRKKGIKQKLNIFHYYLVSKYLQHLVLTEGWQNG